MEPDEIFERVKDRVGKLLRDIPAERLTQDANLADDLGMDSLFLVESVMGLEDEFGIEIPDADLPRLTTLGSVAEYVGMRLAEGECAASS